MNSEKILHYYIYLLLSLKILLIVFTLREWGLKIQNSFIDLEKIIKKIQKITGRKDKLESIFLIGVYLLLMYIFYPFNNAHTFKADDHTKMLLFATGLVSIIHNISKT